MELTFGEQIKILLNRNHMTIQDLADRYEAATGNKMSRQNLTQRLKRDNFPEQDMHVFAALLGHRVSIRLEPTVTVTRSEFNRYPAPVPAGAEAAVSAEAEEEPVLQPILLSPLPDQTDTGETEPAASTERLPEIDADTEPVSVSSLSELTLNAAETPEPIRDAAGSEESPGPYPDGLSIEIPEAFRKQKPRADINPLTGQEYLTNTVRRHPDDPDYIQVYDRMTHSWSDVEESFFWDFQQKKKQMLGKDYQEPMLI